MRKLSKTIFGLTFGALALASCQSTDVYDASRKAQELADNFAEQFGEIAPDQTWNTVQNVNANVTIGFEGTYTVNFYSADPFDKSTADEAVQYGSFTVNGGETTTVTFNAPTISEVYAVVYDASGMGMTKKVTVSDNACTVAVATASNAKALTRTAASGGWETSEAATFSSSVIKSIIEALPEGENAADKRNDYEFKSAGEFTIYPVYGVTSANDEIGYYYYNPADSANTYTEVTFIENLQNLSCNVSWDGSSYSQSTSDYNHNAADWLSWGVAGISVTGYTINVPAGYNIGFWIKNNSAKYPTFYSNKNKNADKKYYSAVGTDSDGNIFFGLEDWKYSDNSDMDCNDVVFAITGNTTTPPEVIVPGEEEESTPQITTIAFEDLGATDDFDYNDVVLYVEHVSGKTSATVKFMAAGGTLPVKVYYDSELLFTKTSTKMINTTSWSEVIDSKTITVGSDFDMSSTATTNKFSIGVTQTSGSSDETSVFITGGNQIDKDMTDKTPKALVISTAWNWPIERLNIKAAYPLFTDWVKDTTSTNWYEHAETGYYITPSNY